MSGVYARQIATAKRLIAAKGQAVTWRSLTDGTPADSAQPWKPATATYVDHTVNIVFLPEGTRGNAFTELMAGTEVPKGKLTGLMAAQSFTPTLKDTVLRAGVPIGIRSIDPLAPNGDIILYTIGFDL